VNELVSSVIEMEEVLPAVYTPVFTPSLKSSELIPLSELLPDEQNARKHPEPNIEAIASSLQRFGQQTPIVINKQNVIIKGNGTHEAAKRLNWSGLWAVTSELPDGEDRAYALADNRSGELAVWDYSIIAEHMRVFAETGVVPDGLGWTPQEIQAIGSATHADLGELFDIPRRDEAGHLVLSFEGELAESVRAKLLEHGSSPRAGLLHLLGLEEPEESE
jgi:ParB-like chromosome segregation protein Spo0J